MGLPANRYRSTCCSLINQFVDDFVESHVVMNMNHVRIITAFAKKNNIEKEHRNKQFAGKVNVY